MASPMVEGRVDPHKKAQFTLHISDSIEDGEVGDYTSVKYNHKPTQTTASRSTTLQSTTANNPSLTLEDKKAAGKKDIFVFTGQHTVPKKSYILLFDASSQRATLEPLASTYTLNVATKNGANISSTYPKIYPRKSKDDAQETTANDLFDETARDDVSLAADPHNPYDFRHFLSKSKERRGDESEYNVASSPDYRTGTGSATNTPQFTARKPAAAVTSKAKPAAQAVPKPKRRKSPEPEARPVKSAPKKAAAPPIVLQRRGTDKPKEPPKPTRKSAAAAPPSSKIKSAEIVHSEDESDVDADAEPDAEFASSPPPPRHSPSPPAPRHQQYEADSDSDDDMEDAGGGGFEIEVPDARPKPRPNALASIGFNQTLGLNHLKSPSNGPISLASAANSVEGSPNFTPQKSRTRNVDDDGVIDFDDFGAGGSEDEDGEGDADDGDGDGNGDVEPMDIGPPAQNRKASAGGAVLEDDAEGEEEDPLYKEMMMGLAGGDSSEESEEE